MSYVKDLKSGGQISSASTAQITTTLDAAPSGANSVVVIVGNNSSVQVTGITDTKGNTYTQDTHQTQSHTPQSRNEIWHTQQDAATLAIGDVITVALSGAVNNKLMFVIELSGKIVADQVNGNSNSSAGTALDTTATPTTTVASETAVASFTLGTNQTSWTPDGAWSTPTANIIAVGTRTLVVECKNLSAIGTARAQGTQTDSTYFAGGIVTYSAAASTPSNTAAPALSGTAKVGNTLTCSQGTWTNTPTSYAYQWQRDTLGNGVYTDIAGATGNTRVLQDTGDQSNIRCVVTATNAAGSASANSNALMVTEPNPVNTVAPAITGTAAQSQTLACSQGTWSNMGGNIATFAYQWQRDAAGNGVYSNISGATGATYVIQAGDVGDHIRCNVTATNSGGSTTQVSNVTAIVTASGGPPASTVGPAVSGTTRVGSVLSTTNGTWTGSPTSFAYQWQRDAADGNYVDIASATASTYTLNALDAEVRVRVIVLATNGAGTSGAISASVGPITYTAPSADSAQTGAIVGVVSAPTNVTPPAITGSPNPGQTLAGQDGEWTDDVSRTRKWQKQIGGTWTDISGAVSSVYLVQQGDLNFLIRFEVTATNATGSTTADSAGILIEAPAVTPPSPGSTTFADDLYAALEPLQAVTDG